MGSMKTLHFLQILRPVITDIIFYVYIIITIFDVVFLILAGTFILSTSRKLSNYEMNKFIVEKQWFWSFILLFIIMLLTWSIELLIANKKTYNISIISDLMRLFGAFNILVIFILHENVKNFLFEILGRE